MPKGKLILICQSGGKFYLDNDGCLSYIGGDAHAISVNNETRFDGLKSEMAEMWKYDPDSMTIKYFLPNNKRTLLTVSSDKDIQHMIDFHESSGTADVFVLTGENLTSEISAMPCSRPGRTTVVEPFTPPPTVTGVVADAGDTQQQTRNRLWENCITGLRQQFNSIHDFRDALRKYATAHGFKYICKDNKSKRVSAKCKAEGCPWQVLASRLSNTRLFRIKKMNGTHTCGAGTSTASLPYVSNKFVANIVREKLRETPNCRPKDIANEIKRDFGIELRYKQAWRGIETAKEELQGSYKDAYNQLPWLCEKMVQTNPGSVATLIAREDSSFHRLFVAFHASLNGFHNGCRPLLFLNTITLKSRYQSELLTASALDGNDGIFPVAFAIVDIVNDDNWQWFLAQLKSAFSTSEPITFVADRQMGLRQSIIKIFENSYHGYCLHHLSEDLKKDLKGPYNEEVISVIVARFYDAAYAATLDGFRKCFESIKNISPEACDWILKSEPEYWANAFFKGLRYNHITSDIVLSFYGWVTELPMTPIVQMIDTMRRKMMEVIYSRRLYSNQWSTRLTPGFEDKLQKAIVQASSFQVLILPNRTVEVCDGLGAVNIVNIDCWDCSCREWQITGLPCSHAVAVVGCTGRNIYDYCSKYFMTETFRLVYSESINPVPTADRPVHRESSPVHVQPPAFRCQSGQPKKRRIRTKGLVKRQLHCSRCKGLGHNRATCHIPS